MEINDRTALRGSLPRRCRSERGDMRSRGGRTPAICGEERCVCDRGLDGIGSRFQAGLEGTGTMGIFSGFGIDFKDLYMVLGKMRWEEGAHGSFYRRPEDDVEFTVDQVLWQYPTN